MKVIWESADIVAGKRYSREGLSETWLIGYLSTEAAEKRYVSISLSDGLVTPPKTKETLAYDLTENGYVPVELLAKK